MLTLNDGRTELWQWDTGRKITVDAECSQVHFSNKVFGRSIDVDVVDGVAEIPDILLQTDKELTAWAFVGTPENGYTKISKVFKVNRRNKPADYVFTPIEQITLAGLEERLSAIEESKDPDAIKNAVEDYLEENPFEAPVQSVNGKTGKVELTAEEVGAISQNDLQEATNEALAQAKASGEFDGADGDDGTSPIVSVSFIEVGHRITITDANGTKTVDVMDGSDGKDGQNGQNGNGIKSAVLNADYTLTLTFDDGTSYTTPSIRGATGGSGKDGVSVTHSWNGTTLTITSASGTSSANLKGDKGDTGPAYTLTTADKTEMVNLVLASLTNASGVSF